MPIEEKTSVRGPEKPCFGVGNGRKKKKSWPISRVLSRTAIHLGLASPQGSSDLPGSRVGARGAQAPAPLFGLAPGGVCTAADVATGAVRSYRTISPLPDIERRDGQCQAVYFLLHFPWTRVPQALPGTLPCGVRTFLRG